MRPPLTASALQALVPSIDLPMCGRCGRPVDKVTSYLDPTAARLVFVAYCHGERERVALNEEVIEDGQFAGFGTAFEQPAALPAQATPLALEPVK